MFSCNSSWILFSFSFIVILLRSDHGFLFDFTHRDFHDSDTWTFLVSFVISSLRMCDNIFVTIGFTFNFFNKSLPVYYAENCHSQANIDNIYSMKHSNIILLHLSTTPDLFSEVSYPDSPQAKCILVKD